MTAKEKDVIQRVLDKCKKQNIKKFSSEYYSIMINECCQEIIDNKHRQETWARKQLIDKNKEKDIAIKEVELKRDKFWHIHIRNLSKYETENVKKAKRKKAKEILKRIRSYMIYPEYRKKFEELKQKHKVK